jgi:hypothetical protein
MNRVIEIAQATLKLRYDIADAAISARPASFERGLSRSGLGNGDPYDSETASRAPTQWISAGCIAEKRGGTPTGQLFWPSTQFLKASQISNSDNGPPAPSKRLFSTLHCSQAWSPLRPM